MSHRPFVACVLPLGLLVAACSSEPAPVQSRPPIQAALGQVETKDVPSRFEAGGTVTARETAVVSSRILAPVASVHVRAGERVRRGQALVDLDAREARANLARASSAVQAAEQGAAAAEADARAAEAALTLARATHDRTRGLSAKQSATAQELDEAVAALAAAEGRATAARARVAAATSGVAESRAALEAATVALSYATLVAPFDGLVSARHIDPGSIAAPGQPLVVVEDPSAFRFEVSLDESRATQVTVGQTVHVALDEGDATGLDARVAEVARIDPAAHSFLVKVDLPARPGLRSGLFGRATFPGPSHRAPVLPASAVVRRGQLTFAFVVDDAGLARLRAISIAGGAGDDVEVLAGLAEGDRIVVSPPATLLDGTPVAGAARAAPAGGRGAAR